MTARIILPCPPPPPHPKKTTYCRCYYSPTSVTCNIQIFPPLFQPKDNCEPNYALPSRETSLKVFWKYIKITKFGQIQLSYLRRLSPESLSFPLLFLDYLVLYKSMHFHLQIANKCDFSQFPPFKQLFGKTFT